MSQFAFLQAEFPDIFAHGAVSAFERYGKGRKHRASLNFGDCLCCACAEAHGATLLFKGGILRTRTWRGREGRVPAGKRGRAAAIFTLPC